MFRLSIRSGAAQSLSRNHSLFGSPRITDTTSFVPSRHRFTSRFSAKIGGRTALQGRGKGVVFRSRALALVAFRCSRSGNNHLSRYPAETIALDMKVAESLSPGAGAKPC
jgi:hypothetical protein